MQCTFKDGVVAMVHRKKVTLTKDDLALVLRLRVESRA